MIVTGRSRTLHFGISLKPNTVSLEVMEGDYGGLVSVVNDQAANYSFDYKGRGQKWLPN